MRGVGVGEQGEFGGKLEAAVAADGDAMGRALEEFLVGGLAPAASVFGKKR